MNKTTKIISTFAVLAILFGLMGQSVSAITLKERDANARAKYQQTREQYQKEVNFYKSARQDFLNAKTKYQQFKNADNKKALEDAARNYLEKAVNSLIKRLETIKNWVLNRGALPESERQIIAAEIDRDINWLNERLPKIQTASPEQIKEEAKTVRQYWKTHRVRVKRIIGEVWAARINFVIAKAENFSVKVDAKIQELKAAGKDTSQLEAWLADFNQKLALAKEKYEAAKAKFQAIKGEPGFDPVTELAEADRLFREGHQFIKDADQYIKQAHAQLVQIVKEMKKMGTVVEVTPEVPLTPTE
jgi:hypothetical protein